MFYMSAASMLIMMTVSVVGVNTIVKEVKKALRKEKEQIEKTRERFWKKDED